MLNARYQEKTFSPLPAWINPARSIEGKNEVSPRIPALQPVATILTGEGGYEGGRAHAYIYPLQDGTLIRLRVKGNNEYDYPNATVVPITHPAAKAYAKNPDQEIELLVADEGDIGLPADKTDVKRLEVRIEADYERDCQEMAYARQLKLKL